MSEIKEHIELPMVKANGPLVFISHDTRDSELAEAFSNLLKSVSAGVLKSFRSSDRKGNQGIEYGTDWYPEIIKSIQAASDVVCLLTDRSLHRPWILFEAGMAKGKLDTPILGVALGLDLKSASTGPFAQFQNCADDEDSLVKLICQLVDRIPGAEPDKDTIRDQVKKFKLEIEKILNKLTQDSPVLPTRRPNSEEIENSSAKLFEEIKIMFQDLPSRIERTENTRPTTKKRRFQFKVMQDLMFGSGNVLLGLRVGLAMLRDHFPWVYDEGNAFIAKLDGIMNPQERHRACQEFESFLMHSFQHPYVEKILIEGGEDDYMVVRELPQMISQMLHRIANQPSFRI
jgi:TIR domain